VGREGFSGSLLGMVRGIGSSFDIHGDDQKKKKSAD